MGDVVVSLKTERMSGLVVDYADIDSITNFDLMCLLGQIHEWL